MFTLRLNHHVGSSKGHYSLADIMPFSSFFDQYIELHGISEGSSFSFSDDAVLLSLMGVEYRFPTQLVTVEIWRSPLPVHPSLHLQAIVLALAHFMQGSLSVFSMRPIHRDAINYLLPFHADCFDIDELFAVVSPSDEAFNIATYSMQSYSDDLYGLL